jgi:deoxyribodipyrimidine photo-lyase
MQLLIYPFAFWNRYSKKMVNYAAKSNDVFLSELIWRNFYANTFQFSKSGDSHFKAAYDGIEWRNNEDERH